MANFRWWPPIGWQYDDCKSLGKPKQVSRWCESIGNPVVWWLTMAFFNFDLSWLSLILTYHGWPCRLATAAVSLVTLFISASLVTLFVLIFRVVSESDHVGNIVFVASAGRGKKICFACDPIISPRLWPYSASCLLRLWPYSMAHYVKSRRKASFTLRKAPISAWIHMITQTLVADVDSNNMDLAYRAPR